LRGQQMRAEFGQCVTGQKGQRGRRHEREIRIRSET
jgi:hypothetical protein